MALIQILLLAAEGAQVGAQTVAKQNHKGGTTAEEFAQGE